MASIQKIRKIDQIQRNFLKIVGQSVHDFVRNNNKARVFRYILSHKMVKIKELKLEEKGGIIALWKNGLKIADIARQMELSDSTVRSL